MVIATWKTLAGFAVSDGSLRWTHPYPMQQIVPSPAVNGDCLIVTGGNVLPCPDHGGAGAHADRGSGQKRSGSTA